MPKQVNGWYWRFSNFLDGRREVTAHRSKAGHGASMIVLWQARGYWYALSMATSAISPKCRTRKELIPWIEEQLAEVLKPRGGAE